MVDLKGDQLRRFLQDLRETEGLSQAELAKRLPFTASRVSRLESGELAMSIEDAKQVAEAIGSEKAKQFATYLGQTWEVLEPISFSHVSLPILREAELALQRLRALEQEPSLKNAFVKQVESCRSALERSARYLERTDHPVAFVGSPGVGKTTAICALGELRDLEAKELNKQMTLQTGSGRTTICEVHIRSGGAYAITTEPCSDDELRHLASDFCDFLREQAGVEKQEPTADSPNLSAEVLRALRNMTGLTVKRVKLPDGKYRQDDPGVELASETKTKEELLIKILSRIDTPRRWRTSVAHSRDSAVDGLEWLSKTFAEINYGKHPEFSLPKRIEVVVPSAILGTTLVDIRLIDTRGVDEPAAPRRDLQGYLDDERAVVVFCTGFKDAPDGAMQAVIERARDTGPKDALTERGMLLVLTQGGEEANVRDSSTGELVTDGDEGREVRREQAAATLRHIGFPDLQMTFLDVTRSDDCASVRERIVEAVLSLRTRAEKQIRHLISTVDRLIANKENEEVRAVFEQATHRLQTWIAKHGEVPKGLQRVQDGLLEEIEGLHASTLRATVNRFGEYYKFDYWHGLGFGARRNAKQRTDKVMTDLGAVIANAIDDDELSHAHDYLRHFNTQVEESYKNFLLAVQSLGETAFQEQLKADRDYWANCQNRWGMGPGYKLDIKAWTGDWFVQEGRFDLHQFVEAEIQAKWASMLSHLNDQLKTAGSVSELSPA